MEYLVKDKTIVIFSLLFVLTFSLIDAKSSSFLNQGISKYSEYNYKEALNDLNQAVNLNKNDTLAYYFRGLVKQELGDSIGAYNDLSKAISLDTNCSECYFHRGLISLDIKFYDNKINIFIPNYKNVLNDFNKAIEIDSNNLVYREYRNSYNDENNQNKLSDLNYILDSDPTNNQIILQRVYYYYNIGSYKSAIADCDYLINNNFNLKETLLYRAKTKLILSDTIGAINDYSSLIKFDNSNWEAYLERGKIRLTMKNYQLAIDDFNRILQMNEVPISINYNSHIVYNLKFRALYEAKYYSQLIIDYILYHYIITLIIGIMLIRYLYKYIKNRMTKDDTN